MAAGLSRDRDPLCRIRLPCNSNSPTRVLLVDALPVISRSIRSPSCTSHHHSASATSSASSFSPFPSSGRGGCETSSQARSAHLLLAPLPSDPSSPLIYHAPRVALDPPLSDDDPSAVLVSAQSPRVTVEGTRQHRRRDEVCRTAPTTGAAPEDRRGGTAVAGGVRQLALGVARGERAAGEGRGGREGGGGGEEGGTAERGPWTKASARGRTPALSGSGGRNKSQITPAALAAAPVCPPSSSSSLSGPAGPHSEQDSIPHQRNVSPFRRIFAANGAGRVSPFRPRRASTSHTNEDSSQRVTGAGGDSLAAGIAHSGPVAGSGELSAPSYSPTVSSGPSPSISLVARVGGRNYVRGAGGNSGRERGGDGVNAIVALEPAMVVVTGMDDLDSDEEDEELEGRGGRRGVAVVSGHRQEERERHRQGEHPQQQEGDSLLQQSERTVDRVLDRVAGLQQSEGAAERVIDRVAVRVSQSQQHTPLSANNHSHHRANVSTHNSNGQSVQSRGSDANNENFQQHHYQSASNHLQHHHPAQGSSLPTASRKIGDLAWEEDIRSSKEWLNPGVYVVGELVIVRRSTDEWRYAEVISVAQDGVQLRVGPGLTKDVATRLISTHVKKLAARGVVSVGRALFAPECGHLYHFDCIRENVRHGNLSCPLCRHVLQEKPTVITSVPISGRSPSRIRASPPGDIATPSSHHHGLPAGPAAGHNHISAGHVAIREREGVGPGSSSSAGGANAGASHHSPPLHHHPRQENRAQQLDRGNDAVESNGREGGVGGGGRAGSSASAASGASGSSRTSWEPPRRSEQHSGELISASLERVTEAEERLAIARAYGDDIQLSGHVRAGVAECRRHHPSRSRFPPSSRIGSSSVGTSESAEPASQSLRHDFSPAVRVRLASALGDGSDRGHENSEAVGSSGGGFGLSGFQSEGLVGHLQSRYHTASPLRHPASGAVSGLLSPQQEVQTVEAAVDYNLRLITCPNRRLGWHECGRCDGNNMAVVDTLGYLLPTRREGENGLDYQLNSMMEQGDALVHVAVLFTPSAMKLQFNHNLDESSRQAEVLRLTAIRVNDWFDSHHHLPFVQQLLSERRI
ncbi:hypothetical protein CBR_g23667 [Chara braunii]|uniref:RING-type domain-containing protein n=1 Tax=Chara braunii TaxID=69332 RepID=A0A388L4V8_CHABU|nr:hypothetical protein CBR_g23667 [Chara braunii]|eukprot:GBG77336.1 hypothetical protein CBR_g23667 [Chara braunii]